MIAPKVRPDRLNVYWQFLALFFLTGLKKLVKILSSSQNLMKAFENYRFDFISTISILKYPVRLNFFQPRE